MELSGSLHQPAWLLKGSPQPVPTTHFFGSVCLQAGSSLSKHRPMSRPFRGQPVNSHRPLPRVGSVHVGVQFLAGGAP